MNAKSWVTAGTLVVVVVGGSIVGANVHTAQIRADMQAKQALIEKAAMVDAQIAEQEDPLQYDATHAVPDAAAAAEGAANGLAAHKAADAAGQAAAQAAAQRRTAVTQPTGPTAPTTWAAGQAPKGTPIPTFIVNDPNAANNGQVAIVDPGTFCASHAGSGPASSATCD